MRGKTWAATPLSPSSEAGSIEPDEFWLTSVTNSTVAVFTLPGESVYTW